MLRMAMYSKNVALYCAPTADDRDTWLASMQHVALEGRCFVLTACQFLRKKDFPDSVRVSLGDSPDAVLMRGGSAIISPLGKVLAGPCFDGETILTAMLDLNDIGRGKFDFDVVGHYNRPDVFRLIVTITDDRHTLKCFACATSRRLPSRFRSESVSDLSPRLRPSQLPRECKHRAANHQQGRTSYDRSPALSVASTPTP